MLVYQRVSQLVLELEGRMGTILGFRAFAVASLAANHSWVYLKGRVFILSQLFTIECLDSQVMCNIYIYIYIYI